jgi:fatty-acyl-CoA synthase
VLVRGPNVMAGYWSRTAGQARHRRARLAAHRDAAYVDGDGFLFIVGRMADAYDVAGASVHPGSPNGCC